MNTLRENILKETTGLIVHGCNNQGVMGSGVALRLKKLYPQIYYDYIYHFRKGSKVGDVVFTKISHDLTIASAITQEYYGRDPNVVYVDYTGIRKAFKTINIYATRYHYHVKFPLIGAGLGNGDWDIIRSIINEELDKKLNVTLFNYN